MEQIRLDIIPKGLMPVCHSSQYDKGRVIRLNLVDGLQGYTLSDETVTLNVRKPDNNIVTAGVNVVSGATYVDIVTTEQMTACEGENLCEIVITKGDVKIASLNFKMKVEVDPLKDGIESETEIHNLETQIADLVSVEVADQYDSSNVIFDDTPTENHGIGYAVTSEGIKRAIDNVSNPDASAVNYDNTDSELTATNVQDAIDEVNDKADTNAANVGDLSTLTTTDKSSIVGAVNSLIGWVDATSEFTKESAFDTAQASYFLYNDALKMYAVSFAVKANTVDSAVILSSVPQLKNDIIVLPTGFANAGGLTVTQANVIYYKANNNIVLRISTTTNVPVFVTAFLLKA